MKWRAAYPLQLLKNLTRTKSHDILRPQLNTARFCQDTGTGPALHGGVVRSRFPGNQDLPEKGTDPEPLNLKGAGLRRATQWCRLGRATKVARAVRGRAGVEVKRAPSGKAEKRKGAGTMALWWLDRGSVSISGAIHAHRRSGCCRFFVQERVFLTAGALKSLPLNPGNL